LFRADTIDPVRRIASNKEAALQGMTTKAMGMGWWAERARGHIKDWREILWRLAGRQAGRHAEGHLG